MNVASLNASQLNRLAIMELTCCQSVEAFSGYGRLQLTSQFSLFFVCRLVPYPTWIYVISLICFAYPCFIVSLRGRWQHKFLLQKNDMLHVLLACSGTDNNRCAEANFDWIATSIPRTIQVACPNRKLIKVLCYW